MKTLNFDECFVLTVIGAIFAMGFHFSYGLNPLWGVVVWLTIILIFSFCMRAYFSRKLRRFKGMGLTPLAYDEIREHGTCNRGVHFILDWPEKNLHYEFFLPEHLQEYLVKNGYYCPEIV